MQNIREAAEASLNDPGEARAWTVVPNDTLAYLKQKLVLDVGADELAKEQVEYRPTILGCVVYRSFHNKDHLHHTPFVANISFDDEGSTLRRYEQGPIKVVDGRVRGEMKIKNLGIPGIAD
jgi:hypothetical protein